MYALPKERTGPLSTSLARHLQAILAPRQGFEAELAAVRQQAVRCTGASPRAAGLERRTRLVPADR